MSIARIKKNDTVIVASGVFAGKTGAVKSVDPRKGTAIVAGVNLRKKAMRRTERNEGGIIEREMPIRLCKLMPYDQEAKRATRIRVKIEDGAKTRVSVKSGKAL